MNKKPFYMTSVSGTVSAIMLTAASFVMISDAKATPVISGQVASMGVSPACQTCHTGTAGTESAANLKAGYLNAYATGGINKLVALIKAPTPLVWTSVTNSLGSTATSARRTDIYAVACGVGTSALSLKVKDLAPIQAPLVSIQAIKGGASSPLSKDAKDGDALFSPTVKLAKGAGVYTVQVVKSASALKVPEVYTARFACVNAAGAKTATTFRKTQDQ